MNSKIDNNIVQLTLSEMKKVIAYIAILIVVITIDILFSLDNINIFKSITQGVIITMIILSVNIRSKSKQHPNKE